MSSEVLTLEPYSVDECGIFKMACSTNIRQQQQREQHDCPVGDSQAVHPHFANASFRLQSFAMWPLALHPRPQALADAGFFYTGQGDRCVCFSCGNGLKSWVVTDDPWIEHKTHFPKCPFVIKEMANGREQQTASTPDVPEEREGAVSEALLCKVCYLKQMCMTFLPCKHVSSCETCASCLKNCPICREPIQSTFKIYLQ